LPLFVTGILANYPDHAVAADDLAIAADFLDRGTNFHRRSPNSAGAARVAVLD
jgi:capsule polysaccharide modification protein KpsS